MTQSSSTMKIWQISQSRDKYTRYSRVTAKGAVWLAGMKIGLYNQLERLKEWALGEIFFQSSSDERDKKYEGWKRKKKRELQLKEVTIRKSFSINLSCKYFMWLGPISQQPPTTAAPWFAQFRAWSEYL